MNRIAPTGGYTSGVKAQYRRAIWAVFRRGFPTQRAGARALLMPSIEGKEVETAVAAGLRLDHLHLVDRNRAIAAHLKRRYRKATCHGLDVVEVARRLAAAGHRLTVANVDLCGRAFGTVAPTLRRFVRTRVMAERSAVAITVLRGRETGATFKAVVNRLRDDPIWKDPRSRGWLVGDLARYVALLYALQGLGYTVKLIGKGRYRSGRQTMLWMVFGLLWVGENAMSTSERIEQAYQQECARCKAALVALKRRRSRMDEAAYGRVHMALLREQLDVHMRHTQALSNGKGD